MRNKPMVFDYSDFCVDAGMICALDMAFIEDNGGSEDEGTTTIAIKTPGKYRVTLRSRDSWVGSKQKTGIIDVRGKGIVIGDPCYSFQELKQEDWIKLLKKTDYFDEATHRGVKLDTGGDGVFSVKVWVEALEVAPCPA